MAAIGLIERARDAADYVELYGVEPEIQTDAPAWLIVYEGRINFGRGWWADDPICVVIDGMATTFTPHQAGQGDEVVTPPTPPTMPTLELPTLAP